MKQRFEYDEVVAELGGSSFMTKRGLVVEGDYRIGEKVLLVFDKASKRYLPTYHRKRDKGRESAEFISGRWDPTKKCRCYTTISQDTEIFAGDPSYAIVSIDFDGCTIPPNEQFVEWKLIPGTCVPFGSVQLTVLETQLNALTWKADLTDADYCFVTVKATFRGPGGIPQCEKSVLVKVIGCRCDATLTLNPGDRVGNLDILTATLGVNYTGCTQDAIDSVRVTWDVRVLSCEGMCDFEILEEDDEHIKIQPSISEGGWGVYEIQATIDGDDDVPFCEVFETFYVGCSCDVIVQAPAEVATSYVYEATIKGFYYDCNAEEKQGAPLTFSFHDCLGNGPYCDVEIISQQQISQGPPEIKIQFGINPLAGTGTVYLKGKMGNPESVPFCEQDALIQFNCCLKEPEDRLVILYTEPEDVETIGPEDVIDLWVEPEIDGGCAPFQWELDGPGTLEVSEDTTAATYTAPKEDEYDTCAGAKVTITVTDLCGGQDQVMMSINAVRTNDIAYRVVRVIDEGVGGSWCNNCIGHHWMYKFHYLFWFSWGFDNYNCAGDYVGWSGGGSHHTFCLSHSGSQISSGCEAMGTEGRDCWLFGEEPYCCGLRSTTYCRGAYWSNICPGGPSPPELMCASCGQVLDCRSEYLKTHKCCPGALPD